MTVAWSRPSCSAAARTPSAWSARACRARWPNHELVERAFTASLEAIRASPEVRLWGDRVLIARARRKRGARGRQRRLPRTAWRRRNRRDRVRRRGGVAGPGVRDRGGASLARRGRWVKPRVSAVQAATFAWHRPSLRVIEKVGMVLVGTREHETMGDLRVFEKRAALRRGDLLRRALVRHGRVDGRLGAAVVRGRAGVRPRARAET